MEDSGLMMKEETLMAEQTRFAILGIQRTGTTLLMSLLDQHPDIVCVGELFQNKTENAQYSIRRYRSYARGSARRRILDLLRLGVIVSDYLDTVYPSFDTKVMGFKIMLNQIRRYPSVLAYFVQNQFKVIHVVRSNLLKTHISRLRARESGIYHSTQPIERTGIRVPVMSLPEDLSLLSDENAALTDLVSELGLSCHTTTYEKIRGEQWQSEQREILASLGVDPAVELTPQTVKLTPDDLELVIENYDEVVRVLKHTPYESYLD
jgi:LPS sulfotransferase NodH